MKILKNLFLFLFISFVFIYCGKNNSDENKSLQKKSDVISSEQMAFVLEDVYLTEGAITRKEISANSPGYYACQYYNYILKKHNLTKDQFMDSYCYYSSDADEMVMILELIINDLSQKQGVLQGDLKADEPVKDSLQGNKKDDPPQKKSKD
jgi:hypothetical protein